MLFYLILHQNIIEIQSNSSLEIQTIFIVTGQVINLVFINKIEFSEK